MALLDLVRMTVGSTGTGTITLSSAVAGWLDMSGAGATDGATYTYAIIDPGTGGTASEIGRGVWASGAGTLTRSVFKSTNSDSAINMTANAHVVVTIAAEDFTPTVTKYTSGSGTYTPPAGCARIRVRMVGGGGGGGAAVTNDGSAGSTTSFGSWTAVGGGGGGVAVNSAGAGGSGGTNGTGTLIVRLDGSYGGSDMYTSGARVSGTGGGSVFGGRARAPRANSAGINGVTNTGGGGSGGCDNSGGGGDGGGGGEYAEFFVNSPSAVSYTVGAGGSGGAAGTYAGGDGAAGIIIIEEYYY